jgi:hypothetical protein
MVSDFDSGSSIFSEEEVISLEDLDIPVLTVTRELIENYFDSASPFLANLSLCLLCKCLSKSAIVLTAENIGWLLGISAVVAYKTYYDETVEGLM